MRFFLYIFILLLCFSCSTNKQTYWCGDHACTSKSEKEDYFKQTMIVEVNSIKKDKGKTDITNIEKIINNEKGNTREKKYLSNQEKLETKRKKKEKKRLTKQEKIKTKKLTKQNKEKEKALNKQKKLEAKAKNENNKKNIKKKKIIEKKVSSTESTSEDIKFSLTDFDKIVKKIMNKNDFKSFPDINNIPGNNYE